MNAIQIPFLVEAILILAAATFGYFVSKKGRPYGKVKVAFHLFFFLWFTTGYGYIAYGVFTTSLATIATIPVIIMGLAILTQLTTGIILLARKTAGTTLPVVHIVSASALLVADIVAFFLTATPS